MQFKRIHILGASGSGTTTLGAALAEQLNCSHFDSDNYLWLPSTPPFQQVRPREERQKILLADLQASASWVLSGSLSGWGDVAIPLFDLVVFLWIPKDIRLARLHAREVQRNGPQAIAPGGDRHEKYTAFMTWAAQYDEGGMDMRSRRSHEHWLSRLPCPVLRLEEDLSVPDRVASVLCSMSGRLD